MIGCHVQHIHSWDATCFCLLLNEHVIVGEVPLHHSALFRSEHGYSNYSNRLVKEGLVAVSDVLQSPWQLGLIRPSFHSS